MRITNLKCTSMTGGTTWPANMYVIFDWIANGSSIEELKGIKELELSLEEYITFVLTFGDKLKEDISCGRIIGGVNPKDVIKGEFTFRGIKIKLVKDNK